MKSVFRLSPLVAALWLAACGTGRVSLAATISVPTFTATYTRGVPAILLLPPSSTPRPIPTQTPTARPTVTPAASASPTLGPLITRTPAPPAECPPPGHPAPIEASYDPESLVQEIERYLDGGGRIEGLQDSLDESIRAFDPDADIQWISVQDLDVTGDAVGDAVVSLYFWGADVYRNPATLSVFACREGRVRVLMSVALDLSVGDFGHLATHDLNADGVPEIVYTLDDFGAHDMFTSIFIREWDGAEFRQLVVAPSDDWTYYPDAAGMWNLLQIGNTSTAHLGTGPRSTGINDLFPDIDGNGTREVVLRGGGGRDYYGDGPQRASIDTWSWNGKAFTLADSRFDPPEYRFQAVRDGDAAFARGAIDEALESYQQSLDDPNLMGWSDEHLRNYPFYLTPAPPEDPAERTRLAAYAQFRILLALAVEARLAEADALFEAMMKAYPSASAGYPYLQMATSFYEALGDTGNVRAACAAARQFARVNAETILAPLGSNYYGYLYEDYTPESVCPVGAGDV